MSTQRTTSTNSHRDDSEAELLQALTTERDRALQALAAEKEKGIQNYRLSLDLVTSLRSELNRTQNTLHNANEEIRTLQQARQHVVVGEHDIVRNRLILFWNKWSRHIGNTSSPPRLANLQTGPATENRLQELQDTIIQHMVVERQGIQATLQTTQAELRESQAELREAQAGLREMQAALQETKATLAKTQESEKQVTSELTRIEGHLQHQSQSCHAQLQHRNDYLAQQIVNIETQYRQSNSRCGEFEEMVTALTCLAIRQTLLLSARAREANKFVRVSNSAGTCSDLLSLGNWLERLFGVDWIVQALRDRSPSDVVTTGDIMAIREAIDRYLCTTGGKEKGF